MAEPATGSITNPTAHIDGDDMTNDDLRALFTQALGEIETHQRNIRSSISALQESVDAIETKIEDMQLKINEIYFKVTQ